MYDFTAYYYRTPTGEMCPPPDVPAEHTAVPYLDSGYHGGFFWAIVPSDWTVAEAKDAFNVQDCTLEGIGFDAIGRFIENLRRQEERNP